MIVRIVAVDLSTLCTVDGDSWSYSQCNRGSAVPGITPGIDTVVPRGPVEDDLAGAGEGLGTDKIEFGPGGAG